MSTWVDVRYDYRDDKEHFAVFVFKTAQDAKEFIRLARIDKDVDDELLLYGDGVLRTLERKNARKSNSVAHKRRRRRS